MKKTVFILLLVLLTRMYLFSAGSSENSSDSKPTVAVSILPQKYFVERIAGDTVNVLVLVLPGKSPATYEPTPDQIKMMTKAKVLFTIGVPFERAFVPKIGANLKDLIIVDTSEGIEKMDMAGMESKDESTKDPHIWMSPPLVKIQADTILRTLVKIFPGNEEFYRKNYSSFTDDLDKIDTELKTTLAPLKGSTLFVYHPSFGYFAHQYGLKQKAIETGGKAPGPKAMDSIINEVKKEGVKVIFVQPEFQQHSVDVIAKAAGTAVIPVDPLSEDYLNNLKKIAETLKSSLK